MEKPGNLLVIMSDEHQGRAMGCAGHGFVKTPNLDRLAAQGTRFTNAYTPSPICVPARASFATGNYVHEIRNWDNAMPYTGETRGWGHALQDKGVRVESIGKLHYRRDEDDTGFDAQHDPMHVVNGVGMVWGSIRREEERQSRPGRMLGQHIGPGTSPYTDYDERVTAKTKNWLADHAESDQPWCLYVGLVAPHFPLVVPQDFFDLYPPGSIPEPKLRLQDGYKRHPWAEKQNGLMDSEGKFASAEERQAAFAAYYGLVSWLDHNIGQILDQLEALGLSEDTTVIYTSDHGDNVGARGLWGKSNMYQESTHVPMIAVGPNYDVGTCETPVSLIDLSAEIAAHFEAPLVVSDGIAPLSKIAASAPDPEREVFSEYHAAGAVSAAFMLRKGRWKYHYYVGFEPELFDLETDPEEVHDLARDPAYADQLATMDQALRRKIDPEAVDRQAFADQDALIASFGGIEAAMTMGASGATPPPEAK